MEGKKKVPTYNIGVPQLVLIWFEEAGGNSIERSRKTF